MSDDLKPCPFCGGKAELSNSMISCMCCICCLPLDVYGIEGNTIGFPTEAEGIAAWNTRREFAPVVIHQVDADRIKQLERELSVAIEVVAESGRKRGVAEAKLAKAVEALREIITRWDTPAWKDVEATGSVINRARTVLAELEGMK